MSIMTPRVAIISPGNMGSGVGKFLVEGGFKVLAPLDDRSDFTRSRAEKVGINNSGSIEKAVENADIILSILDPSKATQVAKSAAYAIQQLGYKKIYADCNATSPSTSIKISEIIEAAGEKTYRLDILSSILFLVGYAGIWLMKRWGLVVLAAITVYVIWYYLTLNMTFIFMRSALNIIILLMGALHIKEMD